MSRISSRDFEPYDRKFFNREEDIAIEVKRYKQKEVSKKWIPLSNDVDWPLYCMNESNAIFSKSLCSIDVFYRKK